MRSSGIFLHLTSLPSPYGIGTLGKQAYDFVDFLSACGQKIWQVLPLGHTGDEFCFSPYTSYSAFAGNPLLIDLDLLARDGYLDKEGLGGLDFPNAGPIDFEKVEQTREVLFQKAFGKSPAILDRSGFEAFLAQNSDWLGDYMNFMARKFQRPAEYYAFLQYLFFKQWYALKQYANGRQIKIFGDIPIYVPADSADFLCHSELFLLDEHKKPALVAGVPPDSFTPEGQKWGSPLYNWAKLKETGYKWWIDRIKQALALYDMVKIDHFRGFDEFYAVPAEAADAVNGVWMPGPKEDFFRCLKRQIPRPSIVAEDLGFITEGVERLLDETGFPGMKVLQFAFGSDSANRYLPHNHIRNSVVYTGTHDNNTTKGWLDSAGRAEFDFAVRYLRLDTYEQYTEGMIRAALGSVADTAVIPLADWLDLGAEARMNTPGTIKNNWTFRIPPGSTAASGLPEKISYLTQMYGR